MPPPPTNARDRAMLCPQPLLTHPMTYLVRLPSQHRGCCLAPLRTLPDCTGCSVRRESMPTIGETCVIIHTAHRLRRVIPKKVLPERPCGLEDQENWPSTSEPRQPAMVNGTTHSKPKESACTHEGHRRRDTHTGEAGHHAPCQTQNVQYSSEDRGIVTEFAIKESIKIE